MIINELPPALAGGPKIQIQNGFSQKSVNYHYVNILQNFG